MTSSVKEWPICRISIGFLMDGVDSWRLRLSVKDSVSTPNNVIPPFAQPLPCNCLFDSDFNRLKEYAKEFEFEITTVTAHESRSSKEFVGKLITLSNFNSLRFNIKLL